MIPRRREEPFGAVENPFAGLRDIGTPDKAVLVEIVFEAVILEQLLIIRRVIGILVERLEFVAFDQQSPPVAPLPEVDRPVHRLHAAAGEPHARSIEHHVGDLLVVDRLEEAAAARGLFLDGRLFRGCKTPRYAPRPRRPCCAPPSGRLHRRRKVRFVPDRRPRLCPDPAGRPSCGCPCKSSWVNRAIHAPVRRL